MFDLLKILKSVVFLLLSIGILTFASCSSKSSPSAPDVDSENELPIASLKSQDIDSLRLEAAFTHARTVFGIKALVVVRNGYLVKEAYFNGTRKDDANHVRSVTKSITSILTGIAIEKGFINDVDVSMNSVLGNYSFLEVDPDQDAISIEHLLTMTSGLSWNESNDNEFASWAYSADQVNYVLAKPVEAQPGTVFNYNSGTSHLLSVILSQVTGQGTFQFAGENLFEKLGILRVAWERDTHGFYFGGHGLQMRPVDMAKIGVLMVQNGRYKGEQILPSSWVSTSTNRQASISGPYGAIKNLGYGYLWWLDTGQSFNVFLAWGWGGQFIYCVPQFQLVVVTASNWQVNGDIHSLQGRANLDLIVNYVLPAVDN